VLRVRVARSKKTGNFKGYSFVLFDDVDVAQIAAEAMDGYLMFEKRMTCKRLTSEKVPKCLKHGPAILRPPKKDGTADQHATHLNRRRSRRTEHELNENLVERLKWNNAKLTKLGVDYQFSPPTLPSFESVKHERKPKEAVKVDEEGKKKEKEIKDEAPSADEGESDGDTTFELDESKFSMVVDSSDDEIVFKTPPNTVRKSKRQYDQTASVNTPSSSASARKSTETPQAKATKQATPKSSSKKQKAEKTETISKIPTLKQKQTPLKKKKRSV